MGLGGMASLAVHDHKAKIILVIFHLSVAFDTTDHESLLSWLVHDLPETISKQDDQKSAQTSWTSVGPALFSLYATLLTHLMEKHSIHHEMFANDTQLNSLNITQTRSVHFTTVSKIVCSGWKKTNSN